MERIDRSARLLHATPVPPTGCTSTRADNQEKRHVVVTFRLLGGRIMANWNSCLFGAPRRSRCLRVVSLAAGALLGLIPAARGQEPCSPPTYPTPSDVFEVGPLWASQPATIPATADSLGVWDGPAFVRNDLWNSLNCLDDTGPPKLNPVHAAVLSRPRTAVAMRRRASCSLQQQLDQVLQPAAPTNDTGPYPRETTRDIRTESDAANALRTRSAQGTRSCPTAAWSCSAETGIDIVEICPQEWQRSVDSWTTIINHDAGSTGDWFLVEPPSPGAETNPVHGEQNRARYYPTNIALPSGNILSVSGDYWLRISMETARSRKGR